MVEYFQDLSLALNIFLKEDIVFVYILIAGLFFLSLAMIGIILINSNLKKKSINEKRKSKERELLNKIQINQKDKGSELISLSKLAKEFFRQYLQLESELNYLEIAEILKKRKKTMMAYFCTDMNSALYSGEDLTKENLLTLEEEFKNILLKAKEELR